MKLKTSRYTNKLIILTFVGFIIISKSTSQVSYRDTVIRWKHFEYTLDEFNGIETVNSTNIIESDYAGVVLENELIRLVIVPGFGARVLSYLYKPTMHEQFYLNPVGTPYGIGEGNFYYDWLMVMGGVFPTFPEPEHGKTWLLSWNWVITEQTEDRISLKMSFQDTVNFPGHPGKFNNGVTGIVCQSTISLESGKTSFDLHHQLKNPGTSSVPFEYWTCCTLAPGSEVGNTYTPASSEIIAPIDYVYLKDDWWGWMGTVEEPAQGMGPHVFNYENLAIYENWKDMGIAYAHPSIESPYYGVINQENNEGVFRFASNNEITQGMKFWTWGATQGLSADPYDYFDIARPYIELWSGLSTQFFTDAFLPAGDSVSWTETYIPTLQLEFISNLNDHGAVALEHTAGVTSEQLSAQVFMNTPDTTFRLNISLNGLSQTELYNDFFMANSLNCEARSFSIDDYGIEDGEYSLDAKVFTESGEEILTASIPVIIPISSWGVADRENMVSRITRLSEYSCKIEFVNARQRLISVYSLDGKLISSKEENNTFSIINIESHGIHVIRIVEEDYSFSIKFFL